jgi:hypothetical protein
MKTWSSGGTKEERNLLQGEKDRLRVVTRWRVRLASKKRHRRISRIGKEGGSPKEFIARKF